MALLLMWLPDGGGSQVFRTTATISPAPSVVVITGHGLAMEAKVRQGLVAGARAVLDKQFDVPALLGTVR